MDKIMLPGSFTGVGRVKFCIKICIKITTNNPRWHALQGAVTINMFMVFKLGLK